MKIAISIFLTLLLFTGCSTLNFQNTISSKEELINRANKGDIKAIVVLNKYYKFPETKEGLDLYNKWYDDINKEDDPKDILEFSKIFKKYNSMFINGVQKSKKLYNLLIEKDEILFELLKFHLKEDYRKRKEIEEKILKTADQETFRKLYELYYKERLSINKRLLEKADQETLQNLYNLYSNSYKNTSTIIEVMKGKGFTYTQPIEEKIKNLLRKNKKQELTKLIDELIMSKNTKEIFQAANYLKKRSYKYKNALKLYEAGLKLDNKNAKAYFELAEIYFKGKYNEKLKKDRDKALELLEKAAIYNYPKANELLLINYSKDKKYLDKYFSLVKKLQKSIEGRKTLATYYKKSRRKTNENKILDELAQDGDEESILELALRKQSKYNFNPEEFKLSKKWQNSILEGNNSQLIQKFRDKIFSRSYRSSYGFEEIRKKFIDKDLKEKNIITLRKLYQKNSYKNSELALKYLKQVAEFGDVKSNFDLARHYLYDDTLYDNTQKALAIYEALAQKGDIKALTTLGDFFLSPPNKKKQFKDTNKGLSYYEKAANMNDSSSIRRLAHLYLCGYCSKKENLIDYKKAKIYLEKLAKDGNKWAIFNLAWMYQNGKGVDKDLLKAKKYYEKTITYSTDTYYNLALLYYKKDEAIEVNYKKALEYIKEGIKFKNAKCMNLLGIFYEKGLGVEKNIKTALEYYKKSYKKSRNPYAAYNIGSIYHYAKGVTKDLKLAKQWYKKSTYDKAKKELEKLK